MVALCWGYVVLVSVEGVRMRDWCTVVGVGGERVMGVTIVC